MDFLSDGYTVGERFGSTTFVPGRGIQMNSATSYVRYQLPATVASGEFSMEVENLAPNGPYPKQAILSMAQGLASVNGNPYEFFAQYRGAPGNPDNCITFKAVMAGPALEFNSGERSQAVMSLNAATTYFWRATWNATSFRLVVREGGVNGRVIYDRDRLGGNNYSPAPHVAYLGINSGDGSFTGMIVRNVWLSGNPRPASLGREMGPR